MARLIATKDACHCSRSRLILSTEIAYSAVCDNETILKSCSQLCLILSKTISDHGLKLSEVFDSIAIQSCALLALGFTAWPSSNIFKTHWVPVEK